MVVFCMLDNGILSVIMACVFFIGMLSVSGCVAVFFQRRMEEVLAPVIFSVILTVYFAGLLFDNLLIGVRLIQVIAVIAVVFLLYCFQKARRDGGAKERMMRLIRQYCLTPGLICWSVMFVIIYIVYCNKILAGWDEFSHWGLVVKNMFIFDRFGNYSAATTSFRDYPPGTALWQYFTAKVFSSRLGENHIYHAMGWLIISLQASFLRVFSADASGCGLSVAPAAQNRKAERRWLRLPGCFSDKNVREAFFAMLLLMFVPLLFTQYIFIYFNSVYVDILLGILFAYLLAAGFTEKKYDAFFYGSLFLAVSVLCLIKAIGVFLAVAALLIIAGFRLTERRREKNRIPLVQALLLALSGALGLIVGKASWSVYLTRTDTPKTWNTKPLTVANLLALANGRGLPYQYLTLKNFFRAIFEQPIGIFGTYVGWLTVLTLSLVYLHRKLKDRQSAKKMMFYVSGCFVFVLIYAVGLLALYLFTYTESDAVTTAGYNRYLSTAFVGTFTFLAVGFVTFFRRTVVGLKKPIALLCAVFFVFGLSRQYMRYRKEEVVRLAFTSAWAQTEKSATFDARKDRIYFICQHSNGQEYWFFRYAVTPLGTNAGSAGSASPWSIGTPYDSEDVWTKDISAEDWQSILSQGNYSYVYLYRVDDRFRDQFGSAFENPEDIASQRIYKVNSESGTPSLCLVNE